MDFIIQWLWYLLAFVVGSLVAWLIAVSTIRTTAGQALSRPLGKALAGAGQA